MAYRISGFWDVTRFSRQPEAADDEPGTGQPTAEIAGRALDSITGHPVSGLKIRGLLELPRKRRAAGAGAKPRTLRFGQDVSDARGRFRLDLSEGLRTRPELHLLGPEESAAVLLQVRGGGRSALPLLGRGSPDPSVPVVLLVEQPRVAFTDKDWAELARRLETRRCVEVHEVVAELLGGAPGRTAFTRWSGRRRHTALHRLEEALLDPDGVLAKYEPPPTFFQFRSPGAWPEYERRLRSKTRSRKVQEAAAAAAARLEEFTSLSDVDWVIDLNRLAAGRVGEALQVGQPVQVKSGEVDLGDTAYSPELSELYGDILAVLVDNKLVGYRDYLRAISTGPPGSGNPDYGQRLADLTRRFHQSFTTYSTGEQPANKILVDIVRDILAAPSGDQYGFAVANLPPQDDKTDREYLQELVELSGISRSELERRYRIDLGLPDSAVSSRVQQNIDTLQGFYRDGFQSRKDPYPIHPDHRLGKAPFFLYFDEWCNRNRPFHPENYFPLKKSFATRVKKEYRDLARDACTYALNTADSPKKLDNQWFILMLDAEEAIAAGHENLAKGQLTLARESFEEALTVGRRALFLSGSSLAASQSDRWSGSKQWPAIINHLIGELAPQIQNLRSIEAQDPESLESLVSSMGPTLGYHPNSPTTHGFRDWLNARIAVHQYSLVRLCLFVAPSCLGDTALEAGDYEGAVSWYEWTTRFLVGRADPKDEAGYRTLTYPQDPVGPHSSSGELYNDGLLPYTADVSRDESKWPDEDLYSSNIWDKHSTRELHEAVIHPLEKRVFAMRHANAMLEWADSLYRTDVDDSLQRARELYKAALFVHRRNPGISPRWGQFYFVFRFNENPAIGGQARRALQGIFQIDAGLNVLGLSDKLVPTLRYETLKSAADRMTAAARSVQAEMVASLRAIEAALKERIINTSLLEKARLQARIAIEQRKIAQVGVALAADQVSQVEKTIEAKQEEMDDSNDFFSVMGDFIGGMVTALKDIAFVSEPVGGELGKVAGFSDGELWLAQKAASGSTTPGAAAGLGTAGTVFAGYALFMYAGYTSAKGMSDATTSLRKEIKDLKYRVLPLANQQLDAARSQVTIAELQRAIAELDAKLAMDLLHFESARFLNEEFWSRLFDIAKRALHRYLFLAGRYAWLAERALAYEQGRSLDIIRFDYFPESLHGITGANVLRSDLAELEVARLEGLRPLKPVSKVYSLAFDFPLQFAQLKKLGFCRFWTRDSDFTDAYPGTWAQRVQGVSVAVQTLSGGTPFQGLLSNSGFSSTIDAAGERLDLVRPFDAQPISGYDRHVDAATFGLPNESLSSFEGSGVDTLWTLEFPSRANPFGLHDLIDVVIRLDVRCYHDPRLYFERRQAQPATVERSLFVSAARLWPQGILDLQGESPSVTLAFDLSELDLPIGETGRTVQNLALMVIARDSFDGPAELAASPAAVQTGLTLQSSVALSNAPPLTHPDNPPPPEPLNAFVGVALDQVLSLTLDKADFPDVDFEEVRDVVLGIAYQATV